MSISRDSIYSFRIVNLQVKELLLSNTDIKNYIDQDVQAAGFIQLMVENIYCQQENSLKCGRSELVVMYEETLA